MHHNRGNNEVLDFIYEQHGHKLTQWNNAILNPAARGIIQIQPRSQVHSAKTQK